MKRFIFAMIFLAPSIALADDALLNNEPKAVGNIKAIVNAIGPGFDEIYNFRDGEWREGWGASLWNFTSRDYLLASLRAGYSNPEMIYTTLRADLPGISKRFVPETVKDVATVGYLDLLWNAVGKYGSVGPLVGYDFEDDAIAYGITLGGQVSF